MQGGVTNGVEMREIPTNQENTPSPDEMTELTEHLRRHTRSQLGDQSVPAHEHFSGQSKGAPSAGNYPSLLAGSGSIHLSPKRALAIARQKQSLRHAKIDRFFLVLFPLLFLVFNVVYWTAYYYAHPVIELEAEQIQK